MAQVSPTKTVVTDASLEQKAKAVRIVADRAVVSEASRVKTSSPLYRDAGLQGESSWLGKAFERIGDLFKSRPDVQAPNMPAADFGVFSRILIAIAWFLLAVILGVCIFFAVKHFNWKRKLKRQAGAMLLDDEPERSLDEWLALADSLESEGKHREAVRALYLAMLLKFDEYNVARFDRRQTNWEHLARISSSPRLPVGLEFMGPTKAFDLIWYGFRVNGSTDVSRFRDWYQQVVQSLKEKAA